MRSPRAPQKTPSLEVLSTLFERSTAGMATLDQDGVITLANPAFLDILGLLEDKAIGRRLTDFCAPEDVHELERRIRERETRADSGTVDLRFHRADGDTAWAAMTLSPAQLNARMCFTVVLQDVTARKVVEARLVHQAFHDPLTSLANRELFRQRLEHAMARSSREAGGLALLLLDLDNFKAVNDTLGHGAGDRLLQVVARRLQGATRGCDTVARIGGDEFGILLEQVDIRDGAEAVAGRIVASLRKPVPLDNEQLVNTGGSIGIAIYSGTEGTEELLRNADVAMYEAKQHMPGRWTLFDPAMHRALLDRVTIEADLHRAVEQCQMAKRPHLANTAVFPAYEPRPKKTPEFTLAYQPIVDLTTGRVSGVEALARWKHPTHGAVAPSVFIPIAERSTLICGLGQWVLAEACRQCAEWNAQHPDLALTITVNLSARQLELDGLAAAVESVLRDAKLDPSRLILEITETAIMQNAEATLSRLQELKQLGVGLAIDDFGTGYSSLAYLQRFPIDVMKIDRVFTEELRATGAGTALVRPILALATLLKLRTIAEGVEDESQRDALRELGCHSAQGYLFGRPLEPTQMTELLQQGVA